MKLNLSLFLDILKKFVPVKTGALRDSWYICSLGDTYAEFTSELPYAYIQDKGGLIPERRPVRAKALHFFVDGKEIFTQKARAFIVPGKDYTGYAFNEFMRVNK